MFGFLRRMFAKSTPPKAEVLCSRNRRVIVKQGPYVMQELGPETVMAIYDAVSDNIARHGRVPVKPTEPGISAAVKEQPARRPRSARPRAEPS